MRTQCVRCVMDTSAKEITFDEKGWCNFCHQAEKELLLVEHNRKLPTGRLHILESLKGTDGTYNCLIGLSGGVDSSYLLHKAIELKLKPLCFTVDTGYNKPEADENIMKLVEGLKVPFIRYTIDLDRFKELQAAFLQAGVRNVEIPTDHVLMAVSYELAALYNVKTILSGGNVATESIMPPSWGANARDLTHIKAIYRQFMKKPLKGLPVCSIWKLNYYWWVKKIKTVYLLDYFTYNRKEAEKLLIEKYKYVSCGEKHEENYYTWWFQNWYLFTKFGIDKRKAHLSSLINSGQMSRAEALEKVNENPVFPVLGLEEKVLKFKKHEHSDYPQDKWYDRIAKFVKYVGIK